MDKQPIRVLLAKAGLDGHDRGVLVLATALRDAGMEVIYVGRHQSAQQIARAAIQESADVVGLSSLADAHRLFAPRVVEELRKGGAGDVPVILGGFIQPEDTPEMKKAGIAAVARPGMKLDEIIQMVRDVAASSARIR